MIVPKRSICESGLSVSRPIRSAVSSPNRSATKPCITSCRMIAKIVGNAQIEMLVRKSPALFKRRFLGGAGARGARMKGAMHLAQMAFREMRIDLCRRDIAMTEHLLHRAKICAALEQMRREAMAQRVRTHPREAWIVRRPSFQGLEKSLPGHRASEPRDEHSGDPARKFLSRALAVVRRIQNIVAAREPRFQCSNRRAAHRNHPFLSALAEHDHDARVEIHLMQLQADQFRHAKSAAVR